MTEENNPLGLQPIAANLGPENTWGATDTNSEPDSNYGRGTTNDNLREDPLDPNWGSAPTPSRTGEADPIVTAVEASAADLQDTDPDAPEPVEEELIRGDEDLDSEPVAQLVDEQTPADPDREPDDNGGEPLYEVVRGDVTPADFDGDLPGM